MFLLRVAVVRCCCLLLGEYAAMRVVGVLARLIIQVYAYACVCVRVQVVQVYAWVLECIITSLPAIDWAINTTAIARSC